MKARLGFIAPQCLALAIALVAAQLASAQNFVTFSTVAANGYGAGDINSCAIALNNITTVGTHQFIGYYDTNRNLRIGRRDLGSTAWTTFSSGITIAASEITDDHNVIAMGIDGSGFMHL